MVRAGSRARARRADQRRRGRARPIARGDRRDGAPGRPRDRAGSKRQRERNRRPYRARALVRRAARAPEREPAISAHADLPLHRRRRLRRARRAPLPRDLVLPPPHRGRRQSRRARRQHPAARDRGRPAPLAECDAGRDRGGADLRADGEPARPRGAARPADRPRLPAHPLRPGAVRRSGGPRGDAHHRRGPAAAGVRRRSRAAQGQAPGRDGRRGAGATRLARPGRRALRRNAELPLGRGAHGARLGDRAPAHRPVDPVRRRNRRSLRALPPQPHRPRTRRALAPKPAWILALRRCRFHVFSSSGCLAERPGASAEPGESAQRPLAGALAGRPASCCSPRAGR